MENYVLMRAAVIENKVNGVKLIMSRGLDINTVLSRTGPTLGYTALHWATAKNHINLVKMLIEDYQADVNLVAADGVQPIHVASFLGYTDIVEILLNSGADANASFSKTTLIKYVKNAEWSDNFGKTMSLLTFAALNDKFLLANSLLDHQANIGVRDVRNKTLIMYTIEKENFKVAVEIALKMTGELVNARDDAGYHVLHYLVHPNKFGAFRYDEKQMRLGESISSMANLLIKAGADVNVTVNGDPDTLLVNMAAYRSCYSLLNILVRLETPVGKARPLKYATLPVESKVLGNAEFIEEERKRCLKLILKDLVLRRTLGVYFIEEEKTLMDELMKRNEVRDIVQEFEQRFVGYLKEKTINGISFLEVAKKVMSGLSVKGSFEECADFLDAFQEELDDEDAYVEGVDGDEYEVQEFVNALQTIIERVEERKKLMEGLKKVENLRKNINLPDEIILEIVGYLENCELQKFISAFYA